MSDPERARDAPQNLDSAELDVSHEPVDKSTSSGPILVSSHVVTNDPVESGDTIGLKPTAKPTHQLRRLTLLILVGIVSFGLLLMTVGLAFHWFDQDFAKTIIQTVVSPLLGALSAVIGYLFAERKEG
jgi:hypothetical protein